MITAERHLQPTTAPHARSMGMITAELARDPRLHSPNTRRGYLADLRRFEEWRNGRALTMLLVEEYATVLRDRGHATSAINRSLSAVRWWAGRLGKLAYEDPGMAREAREEIVTQAARVAAVENVRAGKRLPKGRHLPDGQVRALLSAAFADANLSGLRDGSLMALAWATGARQSELTGLLVSDVALDRDNEEAILTIRHGKGDKERQVAVYHETYLVLTDWLTVRGEVPGYLFCPLKKGSRLAFLKRLSHEAMRQILLERAAAAKITKATTWHDFRRTFIGNLLDRGVDLATAQQLAGHADPKTTSLYDRREKEVQRAAVAGLRLPYQRRTLPIGD